MHDFDRVKLARRVKMQLITALVFAGLTILALLVPVWIAEVSGFSPDSGSGEIELLLAAPFGAASIVLGVLTWRTRRQLLTSDPDAL